MGCSNNVVNNPALNNRHLTVQLPPKITFAQTPSSQDLASYLAYFSDESPHSIYRLSGSEIHKEIARLGQKKDPTSQLQLALLLARTHSPADSQKALNLLTSIITQDETLQTPQATLARLFYPLVEEQHKTNTQLAQQNRTLKENGQEINALRDKLNALRAIEDSLSTRPADSMPNKTD